MKRSLLLLLSGIPVFCFAQSNFQKGYVVTNNKDTIAGYIDFVEQTKNPVSITFKTALESQTQTFNTANCSAFSINEMEAYQRFDVEVSMSKMDLANLSVGPDKTIEKRDVFLKVLQAGKNITLFSYTDKIKKRFYLLEKDSATPYELVSGIYLKAANDNMMMEDIEFRRQLSLVMNKFEVGTETDRNKLAFLGYDEPSLIKIAARINEQKVAKSKYNSTRFFVGIGMNANKGYYKGTHNFASPDAHNKSSYTPYLSVGIDAFANPAIRKLIYRLELSLSTSRNEVSTITEGKYGESATHQFNQVTVSMIPQMIYNIYNRDHLKVFLGGGVGLNLSGYTTNKEIDKSFFRQETSVEENKTELEKLNFSLPLTAGIVLHKKIEILAGYTFSSAISNYQTFSVNIQRYKIGVNYLFGK
ncbi:hypothetical protein [Pedobacter cryoconitis]|uniref:Opacity protein-like surface antigen n=1 Tax=Pedobacter cryoconitis TaxID=188932 RepID=A0A7X0MK89_9SPHI|nr:hypothetical protein [Pedobacter cryoconitis]MBB6500435.1 opacity protein-like surface antigen [Pedobacter cryoconitis]